MSAIAMTDVGRARASVCEARMLRPTADEWTSTGDHVTRFRRSTTSEDSAGQLGAKVRLHRAWTCDMNWTPDLQNISRQSDDYLTRNLGDDTVTRLELVALWSSSGWHWCTVHIPGAVLGRNTWGLGPSPSLLPFPSFPSPSPLEVGLLKYDWGSGGAL